MTREEAIKILSSRDGFGIPKGYTSGYTEAIDMAIRSLEAWDKVIDAIQLFYTYSECKHTVKSCMSIVKKHIKEVEDGQVY